MDYTFQQLKIFITIVQNKSLRKSADILYLTAPALTKQLQNLENILDFKLFDRVSNRLILNENGVAFFEVIEPVFKQWEHIRLIELPLIQSRKLKLKISMTHIFEQNIFTQLARLRRQDNLFEYTLFVESKKKQISLLKKYKIDLAVMTLSDEEILTLQKEGFKVKKYRTITMNGYVSKYFINNQEALADQLNQLKFVLQSEYVNQFGNGQDILYCNSYATILNAISTGVGYGFLPSCLINDNIKRSLINIDNDINIYIPSVNSYFIYRDSRVESIIGILLDE